MGGMVPLAGGSEENATKLSDNNVCVTKTSDGRNATHAGCKLAYAMALLVGHCMSPYLSGILSVRVDLAWLMILFHHYF